VSGFFMSVTVPYIRNLNEFLVSGLKYVFVPERGGMTRGIPTIVMRNVIRYNIYMIRDFGIRV